MYKSNVNQELIALMRGFFSMPVISTLGKLGVVETMLAQPDFKLDDFANVPNKKILLNSFHYLSRLGLMETKEGQEQTFRLSELGQEVLRRHSSFYVPHSYQKYMSAFDSLLSDTAFNVRGSIDRLENVVGSGMTHQRYFLSAVSFLRRRVKIDMLLDVGCGNGYFLREVLRNIPLEKVAGVDLSPVSVKAAEGNVRKEFPQCDITMICSDATDIEMWAKPIKASAGEKSLAISLWFLLHEISGGEPKVVVKFLKEMYRLFPNAPLVIGELVELPEDVLARERATSIMPEYLFFHELSGQGILKWEEYQQIKKEIPYKVSSERFFDELKGANGQYIPSAFVWCLEPQKI